MSYPNKLDPRWDNQTLNYDLSKHNWPEYWLGVAKQKFPQITSLETVHEILTPQEISVLGKHCQHMSEYLNRGKLKVEVLPRGTAWLDTGTFNTLHEAGTYVRIIEERQGARVGCVEEVAWRNGWMSDKALSDSAQRMMSSGYGEYLSSLLPASF